ncbi:MAG: hypothetical protein AAF514_24960, partial [Verrucomicrobiota bacterium]
PMMMIAQASVSRIRIPGVRTFMDGPATVPMGETSTATSKLDSQSQKTGLSAKTISQGLNFREKSDLLCQGRSVGSVHSKTHASSRH